MQSQALDIVPGLDRVRLVDPSDAAVGGRALSARRKAKSSLPALASAKPAKARKVGVIAALLRPLGVALGLLLLAYGALSLGTTYWRSFQRHVDFSAATHPDRSLFSILQSSRLRPDAVDLVIRDIDGRLHKVVASKSDRDRFINETIVMLDGERERIKQAAHADIDRQFEFAFADREQAIEDYADWFFDWKRSYIVLKETLTSAAARAFQVGQYESLSEAVENDVRDYFMRNYQDYVLKPELRDQRIVAGLEHTVRQAHESYRRVIANGDMRLQLFLARHTTHLADLPANTPLTRTRLDWDAQKWKAPIFLMQDKAFEGIAGIGTAAAGGTVGALALGPAINRAMATAFGGLSRRFVASFGARLALAEGGAVAGTLVQPVGGQVVGAVAGVLVGFAADYFVNQAYKEFDRAKFIAANQEALDATVATWKTTLKANVDAAIDRWFDDARASVVLAGD